MAEHFPQPDKIEIETNKARLPMQPGFFIEGYLSVPRNGKCLARNSLIL
jgi:hypothetical protein